MKLEVRTAATWSDFEKRLEFKFLESGENPRAMAGLPTDDVGDPGLLALLTEVLRWLAVELEKRPGRRRPKGWHSVTYSMGLIERDLMAAAESERAWPVLLPAVYFQIEAADEVISGSAFWTSGPFTITRHDDGSEGPEEACVLLVPRSRTASGEPPSEREATSGSGAHLEVIVSRSQKVGTAPVQSARSEGGA